MKRIVGRATRVVAIILFAALAWTGVSGAFHQFSHTDNTLGQQVQSAMQLAFGVLSILGPVTWFWARRWSRPVLIAWALSVALGGGLAPVVWGESSVLTGIVSGVASLLIAWEMVWLLRLSARLAA